MRDRFDKPAPASTRRAWLAAAGLAGLAQSVGLAGCATPLTAYEPPHSGEPAGTPPATRG